MSTEDKSKINAVSVRIEIMPLLTNKVRFSPSCLSEERFANSVKREFEYFEYINVIRSTSRRIMVKVNPETSIHKFY